MKPFPMRLRNHTQYLADIKRKIELNFKYPLSIAQLAREAGVSESKLQHEFPLAFALNIQEYQMQVRMDAAKSLLESCDHSQKYIASAIGYKSSRSFIRAFRQATGSTPEQYRDNL